MIEKGAIKFTTEAAAEAAAKTASGAFFVSSFPVQAVASPISSYASSGWQVGPEFRDRQGQDEIEESEKESDQYNEEGLKYPKKDHDHQPDRAQFKHFLSDFTKEIAKIVGRKEANKWLE